MALSRARSVTLFVLIVVGAVAVAVLVGWWLATLEGTPGSRATVTVIEVVDGDTIVVHDGRGEDTVRLLGIDTPETVHPDRPVECFGPEASAYLTERLLGTTVDLESDREARDRYDRRLAYVYLDGVRINDEMLQLGYAELLVIEPNDRHARAMLGAETEARLDARGLWGAC